MTPRSLLLVGVLLGGVGAGLAVSAGDAGTAVVVPLIVVLVVAAVLVLGRTR